MDNITKHFAERSSVYNVHCGWVKQEDILQEMAAPIKDDDQEIKILDLGAGTGAVSNYLSKNINPLAQVYALDISKEMLEKISNPLIHKIEGSAEQLPFGNAFFDYVVSRQCLHYIEHIDIAMDEIFRVLKPGGIFILSQIVPIENECIQHWIEFTRFRQPLRKTFFSQSDWIRVTENHGFELLNVANHTHRGSMNRWISQYKITDADEITAYKSYFIESSPLFKETYDVEITNNDICNTAYWSTMSFKKRI